MPLTKPLEKFDEPQVISYSEAKRRGLKEYYTGKPCPKGHVSTRVVSSRTCKICYNESCRKATAAYREKNPEKIKKYYQDNRVHFLAVQKEYRKRNPRKYRQTIRNCIDKNPGVYNALTAAYRARKRNAIPEWLTDEHKKQIKLIYQKARNMSDETGTKHHVDHIVPLSGDSCSGLHVPWNLQILTATENCAKQNKVIGYVAEASV